MSPPWDPASGLLDLEGIEKIDAVIHLAGENIGQGRWTKKKKKKIVESRSKSTALIAEKIVKLDPLPKVLISVHP